MIRIKIDELQQELNILNDKWTVAFDSLAQINAQFKELQQAEERTKLEEARLSILIVLREISQDMSAMEAEIRRLREAERQGILYITFQIYVNIDAIFMLTNIIT